MFQYVVFLTTQDADWRFSWRWRYSSWFFGLFRRVVWWLDTDVSEDFAEDGSAATQKTTDYRHTTKMIIYASVPCNISIVGYLYRL